MTTKIINFTEMSCENDAKKSKKIIGFDKTIGNVVMVPDTHGNGLGVKTVACGPPALDFGGSKNASETIDFRRLAANTQYGTALEDTAAGAYLRG